MAAECIVHNSINTDLFPANIFLSKFVGILVLSWASGNSGSSGRLKGELCICNFPAGDWVVVIVGSWEDVRRITFFFSLILNKT